MSIFSIGGRPEKVPQDAILEDMMQDRYFLPGTIHGGEDYLVRVYLNDAHSEDSESSDHDQFEIDYITRDLITQAQEEDHSLGDEFYQILFRAENFCCPNDGESDFASIIEAWPESVYMTHSELVKWAERRYTLPEYRERVVSFRERSSKETLYGLLEPDGSVTEFYPGRTYKPEEIWITGLDIPEEQVPIIRNFTDDTCNDYSCITGPAGCRIHAWECPKFKEYLEKKTFRVLYEEVVLHEFSVDAHDPDDAQDEFGHLADRCALDFMDGDIVSGQITKVIGPKDEETVVNKSHADLEFLSENPQKLEISLGDGYTLVAEKNIDSDYREIFIYLRNEEDGCAWQDLAIVRENYRLVEEGGKTKVLPIHGSYSVMVYENPQDEDYTQSLPIGRREDTEEI